MRLAGRFGNSTYKWLEHTIQVAIRQFYKYFKSSQYNKILIIFNTIPFPNRYWYLVSYRVTIPIPYLVAVAMFCVNLPFSPSLLEVGKHMAIQVWMIFLLPSHFSAKISIRRFWRTFATKIKQEEKTLRWVSQILITNIIVNNSVFCHSYLK